MLQRRRQLEEGHDGFFLYTPRWMHMTLTVSIIFLLVLVLIPATFLFYKAVFLLVPLVCVNFGLGLYLLAQGMARSSLDEEIGGWYGVSRALPDLTICLGITGRPTMLSMCPEPSWPVSRPRLSLYVDLACPL